MATAIGLIGAGGRMGHALADIILAAGGLSLAGGIDRPGHPDIGSPLIPGCAQLLGSDAAGLAQGSDVLIDFSAPAGLQASLAVAMAAAKPIVIGITGLEAEHQRLIDEAAATIPVLWSANMSLGVTLLAALVRTAAARLGDDWDIELVEMHHRHKVDAPSGTALLLAQAAAAGRHVNLADKRVAGRDGITGARRAGDIGFASLRGGSVAGDHSVIFAGEHERIEMTHRAESRAIFARGAVRAALWLVRQPPGRYSMADVLDLRL